MSGLDALHARLISIGEEIDDLAMDRLREAVERGEDSVPASEKKLAQARRAIEKATHLVGALVDESPNS